ncbi:hypothetical protein QAD02_000725 [Eretmocerus hayati]|uniref:Uncharacterized protein n=1 Tax=Eretmocerus hayati TaxID=131215 RepID=A0ACC2NF02_9HYME|nr:hypothetical protein QAD02_000725 [Eretmocerus hayati]
MDLVHIIKIGGNHDYLRILLHLGADVNQLSETGETPLEAAVMKGCPHLVSMLLEHGANVDTPPRPMTRSLAEACFRLIPQERIPNDAKFRIFECLLCHGMKLDTLGEFPFISPVVLETVTSDLLHLLMRAGMQVPGYYEDEEMLAIELALANRDKTLWKVLATDNRVDLSEYNWEGRSILMIEARYDSPYLAELLEFGANPNDRNGPELPLTLAMYEEDITRNFKLLFPLSNPDNISLAFVQACLTRHANYKRFIIHELALESIVEPHVASIEIATKFGRFFNDEFNGCLRELRGALSTEFAGGVTWVDILQTEDLNQYLMNSRVCTYISGRMRPIPSGYFWPELYKKICQIRRIVVLREEAETKLAGIMGLRLKFHPYVLRMISNHLDEVDFRSLVNAIAE